MCVCGLKSQFQLVSIPQREGDSVTEYEKDKERERRTIKTNAHRLSALHRRHGWHAFGFGLTLKWWKCSTIKQDIAGGSITSAETKRSQREKRQRQRHSRDRDTPTVTHIQHTQQDAGMSEGKGSDLDLVLRSGSSHRASLICVTFFRCSLWICYTCYTVHTPHPTVSRVSSLFDLPASAVSPRALFDFFGSVFYSLSFLSSSLFFFLAIIFAVGRHHRSSGRGRGQYPFIRPRLASLIADSLQKCATFYSHRRPPCRSLCSLCGQRRPHIRHI